MALETLDAAAAPESAPAAVDDTNSEATQTPEQTEEAADRAEDTAEPQGTGADTQDGEGDDEAGTRELLAKLPPELRKAWNKAFTTKAQGLAAARREAEQATQLVTALRSDPQGTIQRLAQQAGLAVQAPTQASVTAIEDEVQQALAETLGPDTAKAITPAIQRIARHIVESVTNPLSQQTQELVAQARLAEANAAVRAFETANPEAKQYGPEMAALMKKFQPAEGMDTSEYLEALLAIASARSRRVAQVKASNARTTKAAAAATPPPAASASEKRVAVAPGRSLSFQEAYELAKAGKTVEE